MKELLITKNNLAMKIKSKTLFLVMFALFFSQHLFSQVVFEKGTPYSIDHEKNLILDVPLEALPELNYSNLLAEDEQDEVDGLPPRFGYVHEVNFNLKNSGLWEILPNGDRLWRLKILAPNARTINLNYSHFDIPKGGKLFIFNEEMTNAIGPFTTRNEKSNGAFATGFTKGETCTIEYLEPAGHQGQSYLEINGVVHGYKSIRSFVDDYVRGFQDSKPCHSDVGCPLAAGWENEIKSVGMIMTSGNSRFCSGALISNTAGNCKPYFLTADHCFDSNSAGDVVNDIFVFNYESPTPACPGTPTTDGSTNESVQGGTIVAKGAHSDFCLIELTYNPLDFYDVYYAGWSIETDGITETSSIHHPRGDVKKFSVDQDPPFAFWEPTNTHWQVNWEFGFSEGGSSGSPLFDQNRRIIGQLSGATFTPADCSEDFNNISTAGQLWYSWDQNGTDATEQLAPWLDPGASGSVSITGTGGQGCTDLCMDPEPNDTYDQAIYLGSGTIYVEKGRLTQNDHDWYKVKANGLDYYLEVYGNTGTSPEGYILTYTYSNNTMTFETSQCNLPLVDTYIILYASDGTTVLDVDDNSGVDLFSKIVRSCEEDVLPESVFHFEDINGEEKTEFCFGEEIFLNGLASEKETRHFIEIKIPDPAGPFYPDSTFWIPITSLISLTDLLAEIGPIGNTYFKPGYTYRVKLAVGNFCDPWEETSQEFTVVCCNDEYPADPKFTLDDVEQEEDHYTIIPINYGIFENLTPTHLWYVYSINYPGGPITPITILEGETFSFGPADYGVEYFVIHKVITECEERCFRTCTSNGGGGNLEEGGERAATCLGEEIDCILIDSIFPPCSPLMAPTNLQAVDGFLTWTPVSGAVSYEVTIQVGGSSFCHCPGDFPISYTISTTTNSLPIFFNSCFQWSVVANCEEETNSISSQQACYFSEYLFGESANPQEGENTQNEFIEGSFSIFPNPAKEYVEISNTSDYNAIIEMYNNTGQLITTDNISAWSRKSMETKDLTSGLYFLHFRNEANGEIISSQKLLVHR